MLKETFVVRTEWTNCILELPPDQGYALLCAMMLYHDQGAEAAHAVLEGHTLAASLFKALEASFEANAQKYREKCAKAAASGSLGGKTKAANQQKKLQAEAGTDAPASAHEDGDGTEDAGDGNEPSSASDCSWKTAGWNSVLNASWTKDNLEAARGAWFQIAVPWIERRCQDEVDRLRISGVIIDDDIAGACTAYIENSVVSAVRREAKLSRLEQQASGRHPYDLAKWLRNLRWQDGTYADATWKQTLADAEDRAKKAGGSGIPAQGALSPGEQTLLNILGAGACSSMAPGRDAVDIEVVEDGVPTVTSATGGKGADNDESGSVL